MDYKPREEIVAALTVVQFLLFIVGLISLLSKPLPISMKWKWTPLLFINILGPIIYFAVGSKLLNEKAEQFCELGTCE